MVSKDLGRPKILGRPECSLNDFGVRFSCRTNWRNDKNDGHLFGGVTRRATTGTKWMSNGALIVPVELLCRDSPSMHGFASNNGGHSGQTLLRRLLGAKTIWCQNDRLPVSRPANRGFRIEPEPEIWIYSSVRFRYRASGRGLKSAATFLFLICEQQPIWLPPIGHSFPFSD